MTSSRHPRPYFTLATAPSLALGFAMLTLSSLVHAMEVSSPEAAPATAVQLVHGGRVAPLVVDAGDDPLVRLAAKLFSDDMERVTGKRPRISAKASGTHLLIAGTLGHSKLIDRLAAAGKLKDLGKLKGRWEGTLSQVVERPFPGVERAFVIVGSDRRGTAYGLTRLSELIGVSPWYWWADAPARRRAGLALSASAPEFEAPAVKYRGIFINDEDWGLHEWARQTFEPAAGGIGPKTYDKVFELMLRLRLNLIWPAMHEVSREFHATPANIALAHRYGIVAGASHCEPMLYNNVHWNEQRQGPWNYLTNRAQIRAAWEEQARTRGAMEGVWGLGIRGIHDVGMQGPNDTATRIGILDEVFKDQRALLERYASRQWGPVAQAFVPYKEVLPLYDAGLKVPDDVTIVWVDDNFGYLRRLGKPEERKRAGGAGVYWHLSYYGGPHSYLWINTTAPALMWEELRKAWDNDARTMWVVNVGDIKPMEIGMDYFARLAWDPQAAGADSQPRFLRAYAAAHFGERLAAPVADLLGEFYRLGTIRKPELMERSWAWALPEDTAARLRRDYAALLKSEEEVAAAVPAEARDAYFEMVGFPARVLGATGLIFMADRAAAAGDEAGGAAQETARLRSFLEAEVDRFNNDTAGGKWKHMMPGLVTAKNLMAWNSQVRWPWGNPPGQTLDRGALPAPRSWRDAANADRVSATGPVRWTPVAGLGHSARALALQPSSSAFAWRLDDPAAPTLAFDFASEGRAGAEVLIDFLPTYRIYPEMQLRVAVSVDDQAAVPVEVPASNGREDEGGKARGEAVQNNAARARVALPALAPGKHVLHIRALDPGAVIDRVSLPEAR